MKPHVALYHKAMGYYPGEWIPCELCDATAVDIHHIEARGMGGTSQQDEIGNLMALCRGHHLQYGDVSDQKDYLKFVHGLKMQLRGCSLSSV